MDDILRSPLRTTYGDRSLLIDGPTCISLSGGRTSAYLLWLLLQANCGIPAGTAVLFCNTGKEEEATLIFVSEIARRWGVTVIWLEYRGEGEFEIVTFDTASRNGEPYEAIIRQRGGILPNPVARYCSSELKTRTMHRYLRSIGFTEWDTMLGIRADEPKRVATFRRNPHPETKDETVLIPLADAGVSAGEVGAFWLQQDFDLGLPNMGGKTMHGNCDLCFLKPAHQVFSLIAEKPSRAVWWAKQEKKAETITTGNGCRFRAERPSYQRMAEYNEQQAAMFDYDEESISCLCGD